MANRQWPFVWMRVGDSELFCDDDEIKRANTRLYSVCRCYPDKLFSIRYHGINEMLVTRVATEAEAIRQRRPCTARIRARTNWPFRFMERGDVEKIDVTFTPDRVIAVGDYARTYGRTQGWTMRVRTRRTPNGQRIVHVTRLA